MRRSVFAILALVTVSSAVACGGAPDPLPALGADGGPAPAPNGSNAPAPSSPDGGGAAPLPGREPAPAAPAPKADQITEQYGVFVAKHGTAQNPGTRKSPFASIADAIAKAKADKKSVFVCEGTYEEPLELEDGVSIIGGLDCAAEEWKLTDKKSQLASPSSPAIRAQGITKPTRFDGFDVKVPDATEPSGSSIAVIVTDSVGLTFAKGSITAGNGMKGDDGTEGEQLAFQQTFPALPGQAWATTTVDQTVQRPGGGSAFGYCKGGPMSLQVNGGSGETSGLWQRGSVSEPWQVVSILNPRVAVPALPSSPTANGVDGASSQGGTFGPSGFVAGDGTPGTSGSLGTSGSGGTATPPPRNAQVTQRSWGNSGAGGGAGGCPGIAGTPGKGGGASVAVIAIDSPVRFDGMTLVTATGGAGGRGSLGSNETNGTAGADDGFLLSSSSAGQRGGRAGVSGNGAGGPSIAIAHQNGAPVLTQSKTEPGAGGAGVDARSSGSRTLPASAAGESVGVKAL